MHTRNYTGQRIEAVITAGSDWELQHLLRNERILDGSSCNGSYHIPHLQGRYFYKGDITVGSCWGPLYVNIVKELSILSTPLC